MIKIVLQGTIVVMTKNKKLAKAFTQNQSQDDKKTKISQGIHTKPKPRQQQHKDKLKHSHKTEAKTEHTKIN